MKFLKYLLLGLVLSTLPACAAAQNFETTWSTGDKVVSYYICRTEEDIMEVALADSKNRHTLRHKVLMKTMGKECINLQPALGFKVSKILGSYIDHNKKETSILGVSLPNTNEVIGYVIAVGTPVLAKGNSL
tara:strand:+ start:198 stop:593 length:396 start_codon:yes stop_codon:yes gene_type:complete